MGSFEQRIGPLASNRLGVAGEACASLKLWQAKGNAQITLSNQRIFFFRKMIINQLVQKAGHKLTQKDH